MGYCDERKAYRFLDPFIELKNGSLGNTDQADDGLYGLRLTGVEQPKRSLTHTEPEVEKKSVIEKEREA